MMQLRRISRVVLTAWINATGGESPLVAVKADSTKTQKQDQLFPQPPRNAGQQDIRGDFQTHQILHHIVQTATMEVRKPLISCMAPKPDHQPYLTFDPTFHTTVCGDSQTWVIFF